MQPVWQFKKQKKDAQLSVFSFGHKSLLLLGTFFDGEFTTIVAALGANVVIHNLGSAVAASGQLR